MNGGEDSSADAGRRKEGSDPSKGGQILQSFSPPTFTHLLLPLLHNTDNPPTRSHSPAMSETIKSTSIFSPVPSVARRTDPLRSISAISATPIAPPSHPHQTPPTTSHVFPSFPFRRGPLSDVCSLPQSETVQGTMDSASKEGNKSIAKVRSSPVRRGLDGETDVADRSCSSSAFALHRTPTRESLREPTRAFRPLG